MRASRLTTTVALALLLGVGAQMAHANLLTNGSFEDPASVGTPGLGTGSTYLTGWTVINNPIAHIPSSGIVPSNGQYSLDLTGYDDTSPQGGVSQTIFTAIGAVYNISFDVGAWGGTSSVDVSAGDLFATRASSTDFQNVFWTTFSSTFTALGSTTTIELIGQLSSANGTYIGLDNVDVTLNRLANDVPEPDSVLLFGAGLLALVGMRRRTLAGLKA